MYPYAPVLLTWGHSATQLHGPVGSGNPACWDITASNPKRAEIENRLARIDQLEFEDEVIRHSTKYLNEIRTHSRCNSRRGRHWLLSV